MKRIFTVFIVVLVLAGIAIAGNLKSYPYPFIGRWQPAEDPLLIDEYGFQDIQNMRKDGKHFKGVSGHTKINTTAWSATTYEYPRNGFHFRKGQPEESHVLVAAMDSAEGNCRIYENTTAIPSAGDFSATLVYTEATSAEMARFSNAPQGNVVVCNGYESLIWGGDELQIGGFEVFDPWGSFNYDYYEQVRNNLTDANNVATLTAINPTVDSYVKLLLHCDGADAGTNFDDSSTYANVDTANGNAQNDTAYYKFATASGLFDGTGDFVTYADTSEFTLGTAEFAIDTFIKVRNVSTAEHCIISQLTDDGNYWEWYVNTSGALIFECYAGTAEVININTPNSVIESDTEYHVAVQRWSNGVYGQWVNGVLKTGETDATSIADLTGDLHVGILNKAAQEDDFDGWMDELRFTIGTTRSDWIVYGVPLAEYSTSSGNVFMYLASPRPLQGFKVYVGTANTDASTMTVYYWDGDSWEAVSSLSDGTDTGASLAQTGSITFTSTVSTAKKKVINGLEYYWYMIHVDDVASTTTISYITLDAPMQDMTNIWDASFDIIGKCYQYNSGYSDFTAEVQDETPDYFAEIDSLGTSGYLLLGFINRQQGFDLRMVSGETNSNDATMKVYYWNGSAWTLFSYIEDGTIDDGASLGKSGIVTFNPVSISSEFMRQIQQEIPLYWYKISWNAALDADTQIYNIRGIPVTEDIKGYKFSAMFQNRTWLFNENSGDKSKAIYSAYNAPYIFNGSDSGVLYFGNDEDLTAAIGIYNLYRTSGVEQLIITKRYATYRLFGQGPEDFEIQQLSNVIGCIAPLSMAVCPLSDLGEADINRQVVIFQSASGVIMSDGASMVTISSDIANYWDPNSDDFIPTDRQDNSIGWYDPDLDCYKLLISSGSGQTTHNVELEYSLKYREWTKIYREDSSGANPLQAGFLVSDTTGNSYSYGCNNSGFMYRLENGNNWDGTAIAQYLHTKDFMCDSDLPFFTDTIIEYLRLLYEKKTGTANVSFTHYCDGNTTVDRSLGQVLPGNVDLTSRVRTTQKCYLGPCLRHSFKLSTSTSNVTDGAELTGMGVQYESKQGITLEQ